MSLPLLWPLSCVILVCKVSRKLQDSCNLMYYARFLQPCMEPCIQGSCNLA